MQKSLSTQTAISSTQYNIIGYNLYTNVILIYVHVHCTIGSNERLDPLLVQARFKSLFVGLCLFSLSSSTFPKSWAVVISLDCDILFLDFFNKSCFPVALAFDAGGILDPIAREAVFAFPSKKSKGHYDYHQKQQIYAACHKFWFIIRLRSVKKFVRFLKETHKMWGRLDGGIGWQSI